MATIAGIATLTLARWQLDVTTAFHLSFVALTIGLGFLVALLQTAANRTSGEYFDLDGPKHQTSERVGSCVR